MNHHPACRLRLDHDVDAPGTARREISAWSAPLGLSKDDRDALLVLISELVTNAVVNSGSASEIVATVEAGSVRLEVYDTDSTAPFTAASNNGDGQMVQDVSLRLVNALSDRWGWNPTATGKRVWSETRCDAWLDGPESTID